MTLSDSDQYDFFVSYARRDNQQWWISRFIEELLAEHRRFSGGRQLSCFFDQSDIHSLSNWQTEIFNKGLARSRLFLAFLSPSYFASEWCRREWRAWVDLEIAKHILTAGAAPIYIVEVPGFVSAPPLPEHEVADQVANLFQIPWPHDLLRSQISPMVRELRRRQLQAVQPFYNAGSKALQSEDLHKILQRLARDLDERAQDVRRAALSENTVPPYNRRFCGRIDQLLELRGRLKDDRAGVISGIHGLGGIGKTELAYTYAHAFAGAYPGGRFYVPCEGKQSLRDAALHLGEIFREQITDKERETAEAYFAAIKGCLRRRVEQQGHVLLVLDNVNVAELLSPAETDQLTAIGPKLHLLFTTRLPPAGMGHWLTLGELSPDEGLDLLEKYRSFTDETDRAAAQNIVMRLGGFALALELVAAGMLAHPSANYADVAADLALEDLDTLAEDVNVELRRHNHEKRLRAVLEPALASLTATERRAVEYAALLPPDQVPLAWVKILLAADFPEMARQGKWGSPWEKLCQRLVSLALFTRVEEEATSHRLVRVHRLIQEVVRGSWSPDIAALRQEQVNGLVASRINALQEIGAWEDALWELAALESLAGMWDEISHPDAAWLLDAVGERLLSLDEWIRAESLLRRSVARFGEVATDNSLSELQGQWAKAQINLAKVLVSIGSIDEARNLMQQAVSKLTGLVELDPTDEVTRFELALGSCHFGLLHQGLKQYSSALPHAQAALDGLEQLAHRHPQNTKYAYQIARCCNLLGIISIGLSIDAAQYFHRGQKITEMIVARHADKMSCYWLLSAFNHNLSLTEDDDERSIALLLRALQNDDQALALAPGSVSLRSARGESLQQLARMYAKLNRREAARSSFEESLAVARQVAHDNPRASRFQWLLADALTSFAHFLTAQHDYEAAKRLHVESSELLERLLGETSDRPPYAAQLLACRIAIAKFDKGSGGHVKLVSEDAKAAYRQSLEDILEVARGYSERFPNDSEIHHQQCSVLSLLAESEREAGNDRGALNLYQESIALFRERVYRPDMSSKHPSLLTFLEACDWSQTCELRLNESDWTIRVADLADSVAGHCELRAGIEHLARIFLRRGGVLKEAGKLEAAIEAYQAAIKIAKPAFENAPWHFYLRQGVAGNNFRLAELYGMVGNVAGEIAAWHEYFRLWLGPFQGMPVEEFLAPGRPVDLEEVQRLRDFASQAPPMCKFSIPCDFGGLTSSFEVYISETPPETDPLADQARWLEEERGGKIPEKVRDSFRQLRALAHKNTVSFSELCAYALQAGKDELAKQANGERDR